MVVSEGHAIMCSDETILGRLKSNDANNQLQDL
jgi:hypothetical protein